MQSTASKSLTGLETTNCFVWQCQATCQLPAVASALAWLLSTAAGLCSVCACCSCDAMSGPKALPHANAILPQTPLLCHIYYATGLWSGSEGARRWLSTTLGVQHSRPAAAVTRSWKEFMASSVAAHAAGKLLRAHSTASMPEHDFMDPPGIFQSCYTSTDEELMLQGGSRDFLLMWQNIIRGRSCACKGATARDARNAKQNKIKRGRIGDAHLETKHANLTAMLYCHAARTAGWRSGTPWSWAVRWTRWPQRPWHYVGQHRMWGQYSTSPHPCIR